MPAPTAGLITSTALQLPAGGGINEPQIQVTAAKALLLFLVAAGRELKKRPQQGTAAPDRINE